LRGRILRKRQHLTFDFPRIYPFKAGGPRYQTNGSTIEQLIGFTPLEWPGVLYDISSGSFNLVSEATSFKVDTVLIIDSSDIY